MYQQHGLELILNAEGDFHIPDIERRVILSRVLRELLFNVVKHAQVLEATITLQKSAAGYTIEVIDGGVGFDSEEIEAVTEPSVGSGLRNARERLLLIGGQFELESAPAAHE